MSEFSTERDRAADLVFDWNEVNRKGRILPKNATFFDETLRDGLQNPSVVDPGIEEKLKILHLMEDLGIHVADVGLPGSSKRAREILARYADKDFSLCNALSFAVMEARGVRRAFSFDRHFRQYGRFEVLGAE
jgi:hypothetical protein